ncbi:homocysteine S-methyltransferase YbgG-like [Mya arenaria]|uniref:homocysteine S-methyltransferase YbgG-like n=1 Tax=Mya arenaria TaxID=6604 RepID=UPI0022E6D4EF|nr:homocysteine S-methyltransferase YbgG-like [Mya arenaria]XP_052784674.1 homocysteine S-methyltransferase YbgG-like [Mya arenaria]
MPFTVLDGGTATELVRLGHSSIDGDALWSARLLYSHPDVVKQVHKNFLEAGSNLAVTTSYQASVGGFMEHLHITNSEAIELIQRSVHLARNACDEVAQSQGTAPGLVAGSVGPYGACLLDGSEYTGAYMDALSDEEILEWHKPRLQALVSAGVDLVAIETIPSQREAELLVRLIEQEFPDSKAYVTFSCKNETEVCHGEQFRDAVASVSSSTNVEAVGLNCTAPQYVTPLLKSIQGLKLQKPIIVKPNSGESWTHHAGWAGRDSVQEFSSLVSEWVEHGATWIGGCCRVYPEDIRKIACILKSLQTI